MNTIDIVKVFILGVCLSFIGYQIFDHIVRMERIEAKIDRMLYLVDFDEFEEELEEERQNIKNGTLPVFKLPVQ